MQIALKVLQSVTTKEHMSKLARCQTFEHIGIMSTYLRKERGACIAAPCNILLILNSPLPANSNKLTGILSLWLYNFSSIKKNAYQRFGDSCELAYLIPFLPGDQNLTVTAMFQEQLKFYLPSNLFPATGKFLKHV